MAAFFKEMKKFCCQIVSKKPSCRLKNQVTRREDPAANIEYYRTMIADFAEQSVKQDLNFGKGFSPEERRQFKKIARKLKLKDMLRGTAQAENPGPNNSCPDHRGAHRCPERPRAVRAVRSDPAEWGGTMEGRS
ncbi:hypothetical protein pipiens_016982 [Culex pipiens pipiens]|uniref:Uncharacterized protein n=1 Tax=Culex pipiens pipiens TaxID=38569 RepID=A0ABD1CIR6_CULPP